MKKIAFFSLLLITGMVAGQFLPIVSGDFYPAIRIVIQVVAMLGLAYIMIRVGLEFHIDKGNLRSYGWDYVIAMTAAAFPWLLACTYFVFVMLPATDWGLWAAWQEALVAGRFAAPTSAGVLFAMLAAAGLGGTWLFQKTRILAIFDDLDTVLLMIPLKILVIGFAWQLGVVVVAMLVLLWVGWRWLHRLHWPVNWRWILLYAGVIVAVIEAIYHSTKRIYNVPIHVEVLLPAFVLGCMLYHAHHELSSSHGDSTGDNHRAEQWAADLVSAVFLVAVGLSMPPFAGLPAASTVLKTGTFAAQSFPGWGMVTAHVLALTVLINLGKMFPAFCYRREAHWRERLALAIGMWPRGEVGAGVLILSMSLGIGGPVITVAMLCLALNLVLTGVFILIVKKLLLTTDTGSRPVASL